MQGASGSHTKGEQKEAQFCFYLDVLHSDVLTVSSEQPNDFGAIWSVDRALFDGPITGDQPKEIGRVQGHRIKTYTNSWVIVFNVVFTDDRFKGSSLALRGYLDGERLYNGFEFSIAGGTGELTLAEGIVYAKHFGLPPGTGIGPVITRIMCEFLVFYIPIEKPDCKC